MIEVKKGLTQEEKIKLGLIRPYSLEADRMIIEDIEKGLQIEKIAKIYGRDVEDLKQHIQKIKGKIKSCKFKGEDNNFKELFAAIFRQAVADDTSKVKSMIYEELHNIGMSKRKIHQFINNNKEEIENSVRQMIHDETQRYPGTRKSETLLNLYNIRNKFIKKALLRR